MKTKTNIFVERWRSKSPLFFKKLKAYALSTGGSAAAVIVANGTMSLNLNATLIAILGYVVAACVAIAGTAKLTKEDPQ